MRKQKYVLLGLLSVILIGTAVFAGDIEMKINGAADAVTIDKSDGSEAMRITADGKVGIGTDTPATKLQIEGADGITLSSGNYLSKQIYHTGHHLSFKVGNAERMRLLNMTGNLSQILGNLGQFNYPTFSFINDQNTGMYNSGVDQLSFSTAGLNRMRIIANGNVWIGTTNPTEKLRVIGNILVGTVSNEYGALFLGNQNHGVMRGGGDNEINDVTLYTGNGGVNISTTQTPYGIPNISNIKMAIKNNGNVGIGTTTPTAKLEVVAPFTKIRNDASYAEQQFESSRTGTTYKWSVGTGSSSATIDVQRSLYFYDYNNHKTRLIIMPNGNVGIGTTTPSQKLHVAGTALATAWNTTSDRRLKTNFTPIASALDKISQLNGVEFDWNADSKREGEHDVGVIAQEVEAVFPQFVTEGSDGYKSVDYAKLTAPLIEAVKELKIENEILKTESAELKVLVCLDHPTAKVCLK